jgi:DNA-binding CsgD family transcriptional regulator
MTGGEPTRWARVRELSFELRRLQIDGRAALETHAADLRDVLGTERSLSYGVSEVGDRMSLRFLFMHGGGDLERSRRELDAWLRQWPSRVRFGAYNALRPEPDQQNKVITPRKVAPSATPVARALHPQLGIEFHQQLRVLICERGTLLAWVGALQLEPFAPWQRRALAALIAPLRARLGVERSLGQVSVAQAAMELALEQMPRAALLIGGRGEIAFANTAARLHLGRDRRHLYAEIAGAIAGAPQPRFDVLPLAVPGQPQHHLAIARELAPQRDPARRAAAAARWHLTVRQSEALELLAQGLTNDDIACQLVCATSTVEKHVAAVCDKMQVKNRAEAAAEFAALC